MAAPLIVEARWTVAQRARSPLLQARLEGPKGLFSAEQERVLEAIPEAAADATFDATLRISYPFDFSLQPAGRTVIFATSEFKVLERRSVKSMPDIEALSRSDALLVTPSHWSRAGLLDMGFHADQVVVIPHGVDPVTFRPSIDRKAAREALKMEGFTFANVSAMTENKGADLLLRAFAVIAEKYPDARLLMKGADDLYQSRTLIQKTLGRLPEGVASRLEGTDPLWRKRCDHGLDGGVLSNGGCRCFALSRGGFNLPVLEASACGTPVILHQGRFRPTIS
jgi:glycosyltransferase involved in cell wall biosynthesis